MLIGVNVVNRGALATPDIMTRFAQRAEELGLDSVTLSDHIVIPRNVPDNYPYHPEGVFRWQDAKDYYEPLATMAYLAGRTRRIRLGLSVLIISYRNPITTAKFLASLDALCGGRLFIGVGTGWWEEEYAALGIPSHFAERGPRTDEYIRIFRTLWTEENPEFNGRFHRFGNLEFSPKPAQKKGIPIWIGGHTTRALQRVAELGDVWHPIGLRPPAGLEPDELAKKRDELAGYAKKHGRDPKLIPIAFRAPIVFSDRERGLLIGKADQIVSDIQAYEKVGVSHLTLDIPAKTEPEMMTALDRIGTEIAPKVK
jgi:probable F420-dependent oxidoreductase